MKQLNITTANRVLKFHQKLTDQDQVILTSEGQLPLLLEQVANIKSNNMEGVIFGLGETMDLKTKVYKRYMQFLVIKPEGETTEKSPTTVIPVLLKEYKDDVLEVGCVINNGTISSEIPIVQLALAKIASTWIQDLLKAGYLQNKKASK